VIGFPDDPECSQLGHIGGVTPTLLDAEHRSPYYFETISEKPKQFKRGPVKVVIEINSRRDDDRE
jgi:hypothetical protein